jgi:pimeloyl-ACP methyl ester carboxylesterase
MQEEMALPHGATGRWVWRLIPPALREEVFGDLAGRCPDARSFRREALRTLPMLVAPALLAASLAQYGLPAHAATPTAPATATPVPASLVDGDFNGTVAGIPLVLHVTTSNGSQGCTLDSPQQGARGLACADLHLSDGALSFRVPSVNGSWSGRVSGDGARLEGTWTQGGASLPLVFTRGEYTPPRRPQTPREPLPYRSAEVSFANPQAPGVRLAGTLTLPPGEGPFPAVLLVSGSGPQDRDETIFGHKPFLVLADRLTRQGIAVLRVDDRGVGASTGASGEEDTDDFTSDAAAGIAWLRRHAAIDARRVGVLGHSEGALVAADLAGRDEGVAFAVLVAAPAIRGSELVVEQVRALVRATGRSQAAADAAAAAQRHIIQALLDAPADAAAAREVLRRAIAEAGAPAADEATLRQMTSPWYRHFLTLDPGPLLRAVRTPVLVVNGGRDVQVPATPNEPALRVALAGNARSEIAFFPELNHLMQTARTGHVDEYGAIEETMAPVALQKIGEWIGRTVAEH